jgi:hypothetical protein
MSLLCWGAVLRWCRFTLVPFYAGAVLLVLFYAGSVLRWFRFTLVPFYAGAVIALLTIPFVTDAYVSGSSCGLWREALVALGGFSALGM